MTTKMEVSTGTSNLAVNTFFLRLYLPWPKLLKDVVTLFSSQTKDHCFSYLTAKIQSHLLSVLSFM